MKIKLNCTDSKTPSKGNIVNKIKESQIPIVTYHSRLEQENTELRKHKDSLCDENNLLHSRIERKDSELERLKTEITCLGSQLQAAISAKCQVLAEMEEVRSRDMSLDFKYVLGAIKCWTRVKNKTIHTQF